MNYVHEFYERMVELGFNPELGITVFISVLSAFFAFHLCAYLFFSTRNMLHSTIKAIVSMLVKMTIKRNIEVNSKIAKQIT